MIPTMKKTILEKAKGLICQLAEKSTFAGSKHQILGQSVTKNFFTVSNSQDPESTSMRQKCLFLLSFWVTQASDATIAAPHPQAPLCYQLPLAVTTAFTTCARFQKHLFLGPQILQIARCENFLCHPRRFNRDEARKDSRLKAYTN